MNHAAIKLAIMGAALSMASALLSAGPAQATGTGGTVSGTVTDPSGALVAGAEATLTNLVRGLPGHARVGY